MFYLGILFSFLGGLLIGSFINCVVYRLSVGQSFVSGRSFCPQCHGSIAWYDNLPVLSYLLLLGRCRHCHKKISLHYPLVELAAGFLFVLVFLKVSALFSFGPLFLFFFFGYCLLVSFLLAIFLYDLQYYLIPDLLSLPAIALVVVFHAALYFLNPPLVSFWSYSSSYLIGGLVGGGFFLAQFVLSRGKWIGGGDIRLGFLIGLLLGWPYILVALFIAYISGALVGLFLIFSQKKTLRSTVPFGTFLTVSAFLALLYGPWILTRYLALTFY